MENKRNSSIIINSIYNVLYKVLNMIFPLLTATYVSRILLADGVGKISYAQNIVAYFTTFAALGIPNYGTREVAKVKDNKEEMNKIFNELFFINFISTSICIFCYYLMIMNIAEFKKEMLLYVISGISIVLNFFNVDWLYQGIEKYKYIALRSCFIKIVSLILIFTFVKSKNDYNIYAMIYCIGIGGNNLLNILNLKKNNIKFKFEQMNIKKHLKPIFILLASAIAIELYTMVDTTMIGILCDSSNVGYYTNAMKLVKIVISTITAIGGVLLPRLSYYHNKGLNEECSKIVSKVFMVMFFFFLPAQVGIYMLADNIIMLLFGESFYQAIETLKIASFLICTLGFSNLFSTQVLLTFGQEKKSLICTIFGAISNVILNSILISKFQQNGAAVASVISETIVTIIAITYACKYIKLKFNIFDVIKIIVATVSMGIVVFIIKKMIINSLIALITSLTCGIIIYLLINILIKNTILIELRDIAKKKGEKT